MSEVAQISAAAPQSRRVFAAVANVNANIKPTEVFIDRGLAHCGRLMATMCEAGIDTEQRSAVSQKAVAHVLSAIAGLGDVRRHIIAAGTEAADVARRLHEVRGWGPADPCES